MKLALVYQDGLGRGGYPRDVRSLAFALQEIGCDVTLFANTAVTTADDSTPNLHVEPLRALFRSNHGYDLVHIFGLFLPSHAAALVRCAAGPTKLVLSPLSHLQPLAVAKNRGRKASFVRLLAPALRHVDGMHVFSPTERAALTHWPALCELATFVASLGVYRSDPNGMWSGWHRAKVVFFGRNDVHQKGLDLLISGFSRFSQARAASGTPVRLVIAGHPHGASDALIAELVARADLSDSVDLLGPLTDIEKWALLSRASLFAFPSRFDGPPRPIREALVVGTPCLVSYESNMGELVEQFGAGRATSLDPEMIAEGLREAFEDIDTLESWRTGVDRLRTHLNWRDVARVYLNGYASVGAQT